MNEIQLKPIVNHLQKNKEDIDSIRNLFEDKEITRKLFNIKLDMVDVISCIKRKYIAAEEINETKIKRIKNN